MLERLSVTPPSITRRGFLQTWFTILPICQSAPTGSGPGPFLPNHTAPATSSPRLAPPPGRVPDSSQDYPQSGRKRPLLVSAVRRHTCSPPSHYIFSASLQQIGVTDQLDIPDNYYKLIITTSCIPHQDSCKM